MYNTNDANLFKLREYVILGEEKIHFTFKVSSKL